jgi:hypothetical protein
MTILLPVSDGGFEGFHVNDLAFGQQFFLFAVAYRRHSLRQCACRSALRFLSGVASAVVSLIAPDDAMVNEGIATALNFSRLLHSRR